LIESYFSARPQPLLTVRVCSYKNYESQILQKFINIKKVFSFLKCNPHHGKKCVLLGDSAHAMVPFYGQGMNCGFEDCIVFFELLDQYGIDNMDKVLAEYSKKRVPDAHAICDLAIRNYEEVR
jgi:kynurenine 3-monooxygenase